jgi:outer membrane protein TolC
LRRVIGTADSVLVSGTARAAVAIGAAMSHNPHNPSRRKFLVAGGLWLTASGFTAAQPPSLPPPERAPLPVMPRPVEVGRRYTLGEAIAIAHQQHPQLGALRASMNAAMIKQRGLGEVKRTASIAAPIIIPDYEYRIQQSDLGIQAAMAEYGQAQHEVTYAVIRCYYTVVYAREQSKVAKDLVDQLEVNLENVKRIVSGKEGGIPGISKNTESELVLMVGRVRNQLILAETGTDRARAALREAMGLDPTERVDVVDQALPEIMANQIKRETVIAHATTRRGEIFLARIGADVTRLEACAQWARRFDIMANTFAAGADIHTRQVPQAEREPDYKPGAIAPEMPTRLLGKRETRAATASLYADRAEEAARQARSMVGLEAEVGFSRWDQARRNVESARPVAKEAREFIARLREAAGGKQTRETLLINEVSANQQIAAFNEALYDQIVALANLERITAGGVRGKFAGR